MGIFTSKEKKKKQQEQKDKSLSEMASNMVYINIFDDIDGTPVFSRGFSANITIDKFDNVKYMENENQRFKELYPEKDNLFNFDVVGRTPQEKINNLKTKIKEKKELLKKSEKNPTRQINEADLEREIKILEIKKLELQRGSAGSPLFVAKGGVKNYFFEETAGELIPVRWDLRGKSIYRDIAYKKKFFAMANNNLMSKYGAKLKKAVEMSSIWLLFIVAIWTIGLMVGTFVLMGKYHNYDTLYDDSHMIELQTKADKAMVFCVENVAQTSKVLSEGAVEQKQLIKRQQEVFDSVFGNVKTNSTQ